MRDNPVLRTCAKILFAPIIVFGLYVQFHGDYSPGGGFQAGVIIAAAFILHALIFGLEAGRRLVPQWLNLALLAAGVLLVVSAAALAGPGPALEAAASMFSAASAPGAEDSTSTNERPSQRSAPK